MCQNVTRSEKDAILYCKEKGFRPESDTPKNSLLVVAIDKLYTQIVNVNRLHNIIEPFAALF